MAKKVKQKKAGMVKRQQQKKAKKADERRKKASRPPARPSSPQEVQKILAKIPTLALEGAMAGVYFDEEALKAGLEQGTEDPLLLQQLATDESLNNVKDKLLEDVEHHPTNSQKGLLVRGMLETFDNDKMIPVINPILVGIYLKSKAKVLGQPMSEPLLLKAVKEYDEENAELIEILVKQSGVTLPETPFASGEEEPRFGHEQMEDAELVDEPLLAPSKPEVEVIDDELMEAFKASLEDLDEDQAERRVEDIEVLVEDYLETPITECTGVTIRKFLNWFKSNQNPLPEDIEAMNESLKVFFTFLQDKGHLTSDVVERIIRQVSED